MSAILPKITPSLLDDMEYHKWCMMYHKLKNIDRAVPRGAETEEMLLGKLKHAVLAQIHAPLQPYKPDGTGKSSTAEMLEKPLNMDDRSQTFTGRTLDVVTLETLVSRLWSSQLSEFYAFDLEAEERAFTATLAQLKYYLRSQHVPKGRVLGTEVDLGATIRLAGHLVELGGRADRVELHENGMLEVLDYKTGTGPLPTPRVLASRLSAHLYFLLAWQRYRRIPTVRSVRVSYLNLVTLAKSEAEFDQRQTLLNRAALVDLVRDMVRAVESDVFEPRQGPACASCAARALCPAWEEIDLDEVERWQRASAVHDTRHAQDNQRQRLTKIKEADHHTRVSPLDEMRA